MGGLQVPAPGGAEGGPPAFGRAYGEEASYPEREWRKRIRDVLFAMEGGSPCGMVGYVVSPRPKARHVAHIYGVYVRPEFRGRVVGRSLTRAASERMKEDGRVVKVQLAVNPDMVRALKMHEDEGSWPG